MVISRLQDLMVRFEAQCNGQTCAGGQLDTIKQLGLLHYFGVRAGRSERATRARLYPSMITCPHKQGIPVYASVIVRSRPEHRRHQENFCSWSCVHVYLSCVHVYLQHQELVKPTKIGLLNT